MEYKVVKMRVETDFVDAVNDNMGKGWELYGGIAHSGEAFMQAMIRETPKPKIRETPKPKTKKPPPQKKTKVRAGGTDNVKDA